MLVFIASISAAALCFLYLVNNIYFTGFPTGMDRVPAPETNVEFFWQLILSIGREFVFILHDWKPGDFKQDVTVLVWFIISFAIFIIFLRGERWETSSVPSSYVNTFFLVGVLYLGAIIGARWTTQFDDLSSRLIDPGFSLIFMGLIIWLLHFDSRFTKPLVIFLLSNFYNSQFN